MAKSSAGDFTVGKIQKTRRQRVAKMYGQQKMNIIHTSSTAYEQDHSAAAHNPRARRPGRRNFISSLRERKRRRRRRPAMRLRLLAHHFRSSRGWFLSLPVTEYVRRPPARLGVLAIFRRKLRVAILMLSRGDAYG
jgi:hypothetical protein